MSNRKIIIAKNKTIENQLLYNNANNNDLFILKINDSEFEYLYNHIFGELNFLINVMIDDYEDEVISDPIQLEKVIFFLSNFKEESPEIVTKLKELFIEAYKRNVSVFFCF